MTNLDDAINQYKAELDKMDADQLHFQQQGVENSICTIRHLLSIGCTPRNAQLMLIGLQHQARAVEEKMLEQHLNPLPASKKNVNS